LNTLVFEGLSEPFKAVLDLAGEIFNKRRFTEDQPPALAREDRRLLRPR
jgi:hypothetical protein